MTNQLPTSWADEVMEEEERNDEITSWKALLNEGIQKHYKGLIESTTSQKRAMHYDKLLELRHEVWCLYLSVSTGVIIKDTKVEKFIQFCMSKGIIKKPATLTEFASVLKQSPDVLFYKKSTDSFYLGDVSVSRHPDISLSSKMSKYKPLYDLLAKHKRVVDTFFVIDVDLAMLPGTIRNLAQVGALIDDETARNYSTTLHTAIMNRLDVARNQLGTKDWNDMLAISSKQEQTQGPDFGHYVEGMPEIPDYEPFRTPEYYLDQIKEKVEENYNTMFDNGYESARNAFIELQKEISEEPDCTFLPEPKSTLQIVYNTLDPEKLTGHDLLIDYIEDISTVHDDVANYIVNIFPTAEQASLMSRYKESPSMQKFTDNKVYGPWQFKPKQNLRNSVLHQWHKTKVQNGRKKRNEKGPPKRISPKIYENCQQDMEDMMTHLGTPSRKPPVEVTKDWPAYTQAEVIHTTSIKTYLEKVAATNGVQLATSMNQAFQRLVHLSTKRGKRDNIFIPPNGAFIMLIPHNHAPITQSNVDVPFVTITRVLHETTYVPPESFKQFNTRKYRYYVSKLSRINMDKMCNWEQSQYTIMLTSAYLAEKMKLSDEQIQRLVGIITMLTLDTHQKTSELLDLFKYVVYMPIADLSMLSKLVKDKFNIMLKTRLDVWVFKGTEEFMLKLSTYKEKARKPRLKIHNFRLLPESYGLNLKLPSFGVPNYDHESFPSYVDECCAYFTLRGKKLGGNQFMQRSIAAVAEYDMQFEQEAEKYGEWITKGYDPSCHYPFDSDFAFSSDMIYYATQYNESSNHFNLAKAQGTLSKQDLLQPIHYHTSLRGSLKLIEDMKTPTDYHSTSLHEALKIYEKNGYKEDKSKLLDIAVEAIKTRQCRQIESAKEQRGSGRPINTPDIYTKALYAAIELPERCITNNNPNNVMAQDRNKLKYIEDTYKSAITNFAIEGIPFAAQVTEDTTKFSEKDNVEKFRVYVQSSKVHTKQVRTIQYHALEKIKDRIHIEKHMPEIFDPAKGDPEYVKRLNVRDGVILPNELCVKAGWPQGMLNYISTNVHEACFAYAAHCFNKLYPTTPVKIYPLVHSDDSWYTIGFTDVVSYKKFCTFMIYYKKLFSLTSNVKKYWSSTMGGEMVSNLIFNGETVKPLVKSLSNCTKNLLFQSYTIDAQSRVSTLQQLIRDGADIPVLCLTMAVLTHQLKSAYSWSKTHSAEYDYSMLPIELGGYPRVSVFELAMCGLKAHYYRIWLHVRANPHSKEAKLILKVATLSQQMRVAELVDTADGDKDDYYEVSAPERPDIFRAVKHLMPKIKNVVKTMDAIKKLPFEDDGLGQLITRTTNLGDALGRLKGQAQSMLYQLAAEHYSQRKRRMAIAQVLQTSGRCVKLHNNIPMTIDDMIDYIEKADIHCQPPSYLEMAFHDESELTASCYASVNKSELYDSNVSKVKQMNRMPNDVNVFTTITPLKVVLCELFDRQDTSAPRKNLRLQVQGTHDLEYLEQDCSMIKQRFIQYFTSYTVTKALSLIYTQYMIGRKSRLFNQPKVRNDSIQSFACDMYGVTLSTHTNYQVVINTTSAPKSGRGRTLETLYTAEQLDSIYGSFEPTHVKVGDIWMKKTDYVEQLDHAELDVKQQTKHAILMKKYFGTDDHLARLDQGGHYREYYTLRQRYNRHTGKYSGQYECMVTLGHITLVIKGTTDCITQVTSSSDNVAKITAALHTFVQKNFRAYKYHKPGAWGTSGLFLRNPKRSYTYLTYHNSELTTISAHTECVKLPLSVDKSLVFSSVKSHTKKSFTIGQYMVKVLYSATEAQAMNVGYEMPIYDVNSVRLRTGMYEGFDCQTLFDERIINNLTLKKFSSVSKIAIERLLMHRCTNYTVSNVLDALINGTDAGKSHRENVEVIFLEPATVDDMPEVDLGEVNTMDIVADEVDSTQYLQEVGRIHRAENINDILCGILGAEFTDHDISDFTGCLLTSLSTQLPDFFSMMETEREDTKDWVASDLVSKTITVLEYATIIKNNLDLGRTYQQSISRIKTGALQVLSSTRNYKVQALVNKIMSITYEACEGVEYEEKARDVIAEFLSRRLKHNN